MEQKKNSVRLRAYPTTRAVDPPTFKTLRAKTLGWNQVVLAEKAGVGVATVGRAENGEAIRISKAQLIETAIRKQLGWHIGPLFVGVEPARPPESGFSDPVQNSQESQHSILDAGLRMGAVLTVPSDGAAFREGGGKLWFDRKSETIWHTRRLMLLPINPQDLRRYLGRLRRLEVRKAILDEVEDAENWPKMYVAHPEPLMSCEVYERLCDVLSHPKKYRSIVSGCPALRQWIKNIWSPVSAIDEDLERQQLKNFYCAMRSEEPDEMFLPGFTYDEISCWRVFVQAFPAAIELLEKVAGRTNLPNERRMAISLLSSALAKADDPRISSRAAAINAFLAREVVASTVSNYQKYEVVRQFLYAAVEAGEFPVERMLDFLHRHAEKKWEFILLRKYYRDPTDRLFALSIVNKCEQPLPRNETAKGISEYHRELLPRSLVDQAQRIVRKTIHA